MICYNISPRVVRGRCLELRGSFGMDKRTRPQMWLCLKKEQNSDFTRIACCRASHWINSSSKSSVTVKATSSVQDLTSLDTYLASGDETAALSLVRNLCAEKVLLRFGGGRQVPKRSYTLEELKLNKIYTKDFLAPEDSTLNMVRTTLQASAGVGLLAAFSSHAVETFYLIQFIIFTGFLLTLDQIVSAGGFEALLVDSAGRILSRTYARRVALHEAGHFLIAYLLGLLPKGYTLSSWDAFKRKRTLNFQAGTSFCDSEFQKEIGTGKITSSSLDIYSCVALAGVATEWLKFGKAEGGLSDIMQLDSLMKALRFTQAKADDQVRWSVLNVVTLLRRHSDVQERLADAMIRNAPVSECIMVIEQNFKDDF